MLKNRKVQIFIFMIIIMIIPLLIHDNIYVPQVMNDEIGYLANAAFFAGYEWKGILQEIPYYSFAYSFVISIVIRVFPNYYFIAIALNGLFLAVSYFTLVHMSYILFPHNKYTNIISLFAILSTAQMVYAQYAWAESMITMLSTISIYFMVRVIYFNRVNDYIYLGIFSVLTYYCHQRTIPILIMGIILIIVGSVKRGNINFKRIFFICSVTIFFFMVFMFIKVYLKDNLWIVSSSSDLNDYGSVISQFLTIFSCKGLLAFISSFLCKIFSISLSYYFIPLFYSGILLKEIVVDFTKKDIKRIVCKKRECEILIYFLFLLVIAVCSIFMLRPIRLDNIVYTRYIDYIMPVVVVLGVNSFIFKVNRHNLLISFFILTILSCFVNKLLMNDSLGNFITIQAPVIGYLRIKRFNFILLLNITFLVYLIIIYLKRTIYCILHGIVLLAIILSIVESNTVIGDFEQSGVMSYEVRQSIVCVCKSIKSDESQSLEIGAIRDMDKYIGRYYGGELQSILINYDVQYIDCLDNNYEYLVAPYSKMDLFKNSNYKLIYDDGIFICAKLDTVD